MFYLRKDVLHKLALLGFMSRYTHVLCRMHVLLVDICLPKIAILKSMNAFTQHVLHVERCSHKIAILNSMNVFTHVLNLNVLLVEICSRVRPVLTFINRSTQGLSHNVMLVLLVEICSHNRTELIHTRATP